MDTENENNASAKGEENNICASAVEVEHNVPCDKIKEIPKEQHTEISGNVQDETSDQALSCETTEKLSEALPSEMPNIVPEILSSQNHTDGEHSSAANVTVKDEPYSEEIDYGMPIAKTPMHSSFPENCEQLININRKDQDVNTNNLSLDKFTSKSTLDEYLDGMVTPIAPTIPRLRVKSELALFKPPQPVAVHDNNDISKDGVATNTEICAAPPPPILTLDSNAYSDFVADGIATPRISLASLNRLKVKSEFSLPPATEKHNEEDPCENFFDDLINGENLALEDGEISPDVTDDGSESETIPNDYFDDLLIDKLKEKIDAAQNNDLEVKYSDRLKELQQLKNELRTIQEMKARKHRKKQKKSKKKSRKRSRSRSLSPRPTSSNKRSHISPPYRKDQPTSSNYASKKVPEEIVLRVDSGARDIKTELSANESNSFTRKSLFDCVQETEEILTPKQRKQRAIKRATALLHYMKYKSDDNTNILYEFPFVSTVRKLPTSHSYVQQQIYENRSPLHTVNNVSYKFNSLSSRFKTEEWGLAVLPPNASKLAKLVGCDAEFIHNKLKTIKIPAKLKKVEQEPNKEVDNEAEEELVITYSSLYSNAMTQTVDANTVDGRHKEKGCDMGVQVKPETYSIGCQTLENPSATKNNLHKGDDELPLMKLIQELNENQLVAIHSFAELIREQNGNSNAMEMYRIQMQIMDIYKMSQIPSALETITQPAIVNNYAKRPRVQTNLCIESVKGADGRQFTANDPRNKWAAYGHRNANNDIAATSSKYDQRYEQHNYAARPTASKDYTQTYFSATSEHDNRYSSTSPSSRHLIRPNIAHSSQSPPAAVKRYGRGGLRR